MDEPSAPGSSGWRASLRISSEPAGATFDVLLVCGGTDGGAMRAHAGETPFELAVPDGEVTIVVRPREPSRPVLAEYVCEAGGQPVARGRGCAAVPVLHFRPGGVTCAGLPGLGSSDGSAGCLANRSG